MKHFFIILLVVVSLVIYAQEDRYWSTSFNTEASLLAGAVVGGNSNITSIYYNPAGISEIEEKKIMLNVNLFQLNSESFKNIIGEKNDVTKSSFRVQPRFVSYIYRSKKNRNLSFQLAIFTKSSNYKSLSAFDEKSSNFFNNNTEETTKTSYDYYNEYNDYWGGEGISYQINNRLSIGVSGFISVKNLLYSIYQYSIIGSDDYSLSDTNNYQIITDRSERIALYDVRILGKFGFRYKVKNFSFGVNISTPSLKLFGNSDVKYRQSVSNNTDTNLIVNNFSVSEDSKFREVKAKHPFSIAIGGVVYMNEHKSQLYFTFEYFYKTPTYLMIDGTKVVKSEEDNYPGGTHLTSYKYGAKTIVNYAVGYKKILNDNFDLILGFRTDFNAYNVSSTGEFKNIKEIQNIHNSLYHFTLGSNFKYKRSKFILGFQYSYGKKDNTTENKSMYNIVGINNKNMIYTINSLGLFLGFSINF